MVNRGVALLGLVALSPAHASLIEYSFTSTVTDLGGNVYQDFGVEVGDTITGGFLFDEAAARTSHQEDLIVGTGPLTSSELQVSDASEWGYRGVLDQWLGISFADGSSIYGSLDSITKTPVSVPEPGTLSLLVAGALGAFAARRRRRAADA
jgi:PEP-CTERM motif-containing protein